MKYEQIEAAMKSGEFPIIEPLFSNVRFSWLKTPEFDALYSPVDAREFADDIIRGDLARSGEVSEFNFDVAKCLIASAMAADDYRKEHGPIEDEIERVIANHQAKFAET